MLLKNMKRFAFRLQRVLDFRNSLKKQQGNVLAKASSDLFVAEEGVKEIIDAQDGTSPPAEKVMPMAELSLHEQYQEYLQQALIEQRLLVIEAAQAVDLAREAYIERCRESETLRVLRERRKERHRLEQLKGERKKIDEIVVQRHRFSKDN